jgi:hypothetical protein
MVVSVLPKDRASRHRRQRPGALSNLSQSAGLNTGPSGSAGAEERRLGFWAADAFHLGSEGTVFGQCISLGVHYPCGGAVDPTE